MKQLHRFFHSVLTQSKPPLGRWTIELSKKRINSKVDFANEDHCGVCNKYLTEKVNKKKETEETEKEYEYLRYML